MTLPWSTFVPQANAMSPASGGVKSIVTGSLSGNGFLIFSEGNTTSVLQGLRRLVSRAPHEARQRPRVAKPMMISAPVTASAAPATSVRVGVCPSTTQSQANDATM